MSRLDLRLYLVTDTALCGERGVPATVAAAVAGGVSVVQLRDPKASGRALYELAVALRRQLRPLGIPFIVDDRLDVALAAGADGVHLGQSDLPVEAGRRLGGPDLIVGWSVTNLEELRAACSLPAGTVDYLGVGPVFPSGTKPDAAPPVGLDGLAALCAGAAGLPCVAIGGIDASNAAEVMAAGADGVAVVSAICGSDDPAAAAARLAQVVGLR